jgi:hypothetical protein
MILTLCEQARDAVLATSISKAPVSGRMEDTIRGVWLADLNGKMGRGLLRDAIKDLPTAGFLRILLATHFLTRVYWSHWRKEHRLMLLDAAEAVLKPLQVALDKPKIIRYIERDKAEHLEQ